MHNGEKNPHLHCYLPVLAGASSVASEGFELLNAFQPLETKFYPHLPFRRCGRSADPSRSIEEHVKTSTPAHRIAHWPIDVAGVGEIRITFGNDSSPLYKGYSPSQGSHAKIIGLQLPDNELTAKERQSVHGKALELFRSSRATKHPSSLAIPIQQGRKRAEDSSGGSPP
jgi:hypothetical protein